MCRLFLIHALIVSTQLSAQSFISTYTTANAHSHNHYEQPLPFWAAWQNGFGSIEADIFLDNNMLIVAHDKKELLARRTLDSLYLVPLQECVLKNNGHAYADTNRRLQLMIDVKTEAISTLKKLIEVLNEYPFLITCPSLMITISGNRPDASLFASAPKWKWFDGEFDKLYTHEQMQKIAMLSGDFAKYSKWNGQDSMLANDKNLLRDLITHAHSANKKIRFWNAPDNPNSWRAYITLGVDFINTDHINDLTLFLKQFSKTTQR
jgi:alkaline phosphatase